MDIAAFADITQRIIARDGIDAYLPTVCFYLRRHIAVLEGYPDVVVPRDIVRNWARSMAQPSEPYLLAYRIGDAEFQVDHMSTGPISSAVFRIGATA